MASLADTVRDVFRATFDLSSDAGVDDLVYNALPAWDSVGHMRLIAALEDQFGLMLDTEEVLALSSFTKAVEIVGKYTAS